MRQKTVVALSGHFGENNIGDDALLLALIKGIRWLKAGRIVVFSASPLKTYTMLAREQASGNDIKVIYNGRWGVCEPNKHFTRSMLWIKDTIAALWRSKLHLIGPGTIIKDTTSPLFLVFWLLRALPSLLFFRPFAFIGVGVGEIKRPFSAKFLRSVCNKAMFITARDKVSLNALIELKINCPHLKVYPDLSFILAPDTANNNKTNTQKPSKRFQVGLNFREFNQKHFSTYSIMVYEEALTSFIRYIPDDIELCFYSFCDEPHQSDLKIYEKITKQTPKRSIKLYSFNTIAELKQNIQGCDMFIGARYHSVLFAYQQGVPTIGLSYESKTHNFMTWVGLEELCINVDNMGKQDLVFCWNKLKVNYSKYQTIINKNRFDYSQLAWGHIATINNLVQ